MNTSRPTRKKIFFLILAGAALALIFFRFHREWSFPDTKWELRKDERITLYPGKPVVQKFIPARDHLSRVETFFANSKVGAGVTLKMQILEENCGNLLRESSLAVSSLDSDKPYQFVFGKIPDSKGKTLCLKLSYDSKKDEATIKNVKMFIVENPPAESLSLRNESENKTYENYSLAIRPAYRNANLWQDIVELDQRISQYKAWFLKNNYLLTIAFAFIALSILAVIILIIL